jgi:hypothetical protein
MEKLLDNTEIPLNVAEKTTYKNFARKSWKIRSVKMVNSLSKAEKMWSVNMEKLIYNTENPINTAEKTARRI